MDTEITLDLNKPLFSYSRYEINDHGYGDDFIHRDGDHVHLLLSIDPQLSIHRAIKRIKGRSSHDLREEFPWLKSRIPTLWTNSYFVSTVGGAPLAQVRKYIERQKEV